MECAQLNTPATCAITNNLGQFVYQQAIKEHTHYYKISIITINDHKIFDLKLFNDNSRAQDKNVSLNIINRYLACDQH
jgi:hypothetical protein